MVKEGKVEEGMPTETHLVVLSKPMSLVDTKKKLADYENKLNNLKVDTSMFSGVAFIVMEKQSDVYKVTSK
jgi:hypothetical protein